MSGIWKNKKIISKRGFSLIELLISITIVAILTSIVLQSLSNSRARAYDSKIKQQLFHFMTAAEIYESNTGNYGMATVSCSQGIFNDFDQNNGTPGIYIATGNLPTFASPVCQSTGSTYAIKVNLYSGSEYVCIDSRKSFKVIPGPITGPDPVCP